MKTFLFALMAVVFLMAGTPAMAADNSGADPENVLYLELKDGRVVIVLRPDLAPKHVARVKELVRKGFYDGLTFHRVIDGFMAQTGDPDGTGRGGSGQNIPAEFSGEPFKRGTVGAARSNDPNSADSQFFICFADASFLNGNYTVWGNVTEGMEFVDKIARGEPPVVPDRIVKMTIAADEPKELQKGAAPAPAPAPAPEEKKE
jgi:cyclophilin family peptidyl-prolyl cis-trans isomerase